jgi:hypothetical protein
MTFKVPQNVSGIAPISEHVARHATQASTISQADIAHMQAIQRARANNGSQTEEEVKSILDKPKIKARYKIEIFFGPDRTLQGPNLCQVQFFESGKKLNGDGDDMMFVCANPDEPSLGCGSFIPGDAIKGGIAICPGCKMAIKQTALTERLIGRLTTRNLATSLAKWFRKLDSDCDLYCKYDREDIRYVAMVQRLGSQAAHRLRGLHIYPLRNIIKDLSNGASLEDRIFAFLTA